MEEIIGLLVVLAIAIFKAVGKKLENSGTPPRKTAASEPVEERPMPARPSAQPSTIEVVARQTAPRKPILEEPEPEGPKEKIDPKKLVLYSELMKPKFNE